MERAIFLGIVAAIGVLVIAKRAFVYTKVKHLLLSKIVFYIVIAIVALIILGEIADRPLYFQNIIKSFVGVVGVFSPYFIGSVALSYHLAKKYGMYLKKGKVTTVDHIASSLKMKDLEELKYELQCLIDRKYIQGFTINHETNAITPTTVKAAVQELGQTVNKTILAFKKSGASPTSTCKGCGATNTSPDATNCEFCGSPL